MFLSNELSVSTLYIKYIFPYFFINLVPFFFCFSFWFCFQDGVGVDEKLSLRRVAVVEDFFDIIYSMHVETGQNGEQIRKHAGQKRTYKAVS